MMDWTDEVRNLHGDRHLVPAKTLRSLYVASIYKILREYPATPVPVV